MTFAVDLAHSRLILQSGKCPRRSSGSGKWEVGSDDSGGFDPWKHIGERVARDRIIAKFRLR